MRAKFVPAGNRDVGSTVTRITPFHGGNDFAGTLERRVRGETWPKVTMLFFKTSFHVQMGTRIVARALPRFVYVVCTRDEEPFAPVVVGGAGNVCTPAPRQAVHMYDYKKLHSSYSS